MGTEQERADLDSLRKYVNKEAGSSLVFGDDESLKIKYLSLGYKKLDDLFGGGFAFNRIIELIGQESVGKTLLALWAIAAAQKAGLPTCYVDVERTFDPEWARMQGIDTDLLIVSDPVTAEAAFDVTMAMLQAPIEKPGVIVIDSIAAMVPKTELEAEGEKQFIGLHARFINRAIRDWSAANKGWIIIVINQLREKIGAYGNPETTPGGKGQGFHATQVVKVTRGEKLFIPGSGGKTQADSVGYQMGFFLNKNKLGRPFGKISLPFYFDGGIDELASNVESAADLGLCGEGRAGWYETPDGKIQGKVNLIEYFRENTEHYEDLMDRFNNIEEVQID